MRKKRLFNCQRRLKHGQGKIKALGIPAGEPVHDHNFA